MHPDRRLHTAFWARGFVPRAKMPPSPTHGASWNAPNRLVGRICWKRLMALEPTTFCMASRPTPVVAHRFLPAKTAFSRSTRGAGLPSFRHVSPGFCQPIVNGSTRIRIVSGARRLARSTASVCRSGSLTCASAAGPTRDPAGSRWRRSHPSDSASGESRREFLIGQMPLDVEAFGVASVGGAGEGR
jgi:hypothetical protein